MKVAEGMRNITENIVAAHHVRVKALGHLVNEVSDSLDNAQKMMKDVAADRKAMSKEQAAELAGFAGDLAGSVGRMIKDFAADRKAMSKDQAAELAGFAGEIASSVGAQLKGFHKELELVAKERVLSGKELKDRLYKEAKDLSNLVAKTLNNYHKDHAEMSAAQRQHLHGFVKDIVKTVGDLTTTTRGLMGGYRADVRRAGSIWSDMSRKLAKARAQQDEAPIVEGGETVGTLEGAVHKIHRRRRKKSRK